MTVRALPDDLISSGVIGLMDAIEKYDASRDNKFKTYAEFRIRGAILDELRAQDWVPRSVREKAKLLERCYTKIEQQKGQMQRWEKQTQLEDPAIASDASRLLVVHEEMEAVRKELDALYARWAELEEKQG